MSEDDVDMLAADGQGSGKVDRDRRAPRFSWTPAYEATFFRSLCESVQLGLRENSSFKAEAWERAAQALQESHGASPTKNHLINKSDNARKRFRLWRGLREDPDFVYNSKARTVTATEEAWRAHIEREPLSRALRGRPFDHEDYMETLYPDVIGSGGAPKRIMKPKRRDGQPGDESELSGVNSSILGSDQPTNGQQSTLDSPSGAQAPNMSSAAASSSGPSQPMSVTPSAAAVSAATSGSALTPPEDPTALSRKRGPPVAEMDATLSASNTSSRHEHTQLGSPEKRLRFSTSDDTGLVTPATATAPATLLANSRRTGGADASSSSHDLDSAKHRGIQDLLGAIAGSSSSQWCEKAVDLFYRDFSSEELDLQVRIPQDLLSNEHTAMVFCKMPYQVREHWLRACSFFIYINTASLSVLHTTCASHCIDHLGCAALNYKNKRNTLLTATETLFQPSIVGFHPSASTFSPCESLQIFLTTSPVSYAKAASKGPKQSPSEAAAPPPPEIIPNESASTSSLIDVDMPSVHTVPSDFMEQDVQTETQAHRIEREAEAAKAKAERARKEATAKAKKADSWLTKQTSQLSDEAASGIALANLATFVGIGSYLGYKAWNLYEKGNLDGKSIGLGVGILAAAGAAHAVVGSYLYRGKKN